MLNFKVNQVINVKPSTEVNIAEYWKKRNWKIIKVYDKVIAVQGISLNNDSELIQERHTISENFALNYLNIQIVK